MTAAGIAPVAVGVAAAAAVVYAGGVVAVASGPGYHLIADAACERAVRALRAHGDHGDQPLPVMVADLDEARTVCIVDGRAATALAASRQPVPLDRRVGLAAWQRIAPSVAPGRRRIGLMLPTTPLHATLLDAVGPPVVVTGCSGRLPAMTGAVFS